MAGKTRANADGTTFTVRTVRGLAATEYVVRHSVIPTAGGTLMRLDGPMYLTGLGRNPEALVRIRHPEYDYAATEADGARIALEFFADSYAACVAEAEKDGLPVRQYFA